MRRKLSYVAALALSLIAFAEVPTCRYCGAVIDTSTTPNIERMLDDTIMDETGMHTTLRKVLENGSYSKPYILAIIRLGDRPAWISSTLTIIKYLKQSPCNIKLGFLFMDADFANASQSKAIVEKKTGTKDFDLFHTMSYTDGADKIKISRWRLEATPAFCIINGDKKSVKIAYPAVFSDKELFDNILLQIKCIKD